MIVYGVFLLPAEFFNISIIRGPISPIATIWRMLLLLMVSIKSVKSLFLSEPPIINTFGWSYALIATSAVAGLVPNESSTKVTPFRVPISSSLCGKPTKPSKAFLIIFGRFPIKSQVAPIEAQTFCRL